jgi:uncharacterized membrane protein
MSTGLNFVNASMLFVGIILIYAGVKGKTPITVIQESTANKPAASTKNSNAVFTDPTATGK